MKRSIILLWLVSCSAGAFAQSNDLADSLYFLQTGKHLSRKSSPGNDTYHATSQDIYFYKPSREYNHFAQTNATQLLADTLDRTGILQFYYHNAAGNLHLSQQAYNTQTASLYTEGFSTLGRVKIGGSFRFSKHWEDSLANNMGMPADGISPYYYFTPKAGRYEGQHYAMSAVLGWNIINEKIYLGLKTDYTYDWITGSVDPRLNDKHLQVKVFPSITYQAHNTFLGLEYLTGYGNATMNIIYKSDVYNLSTLFPERFYYLNMGYGDIALKYQVINNCDAGYQGAGFHFSTILNRFNIRGNISYEKGITRYKQNFDTLRVSDLFSRWDLGHYTADLLVTRNSDMATQQLSLKIHSLKGSDFNTLYNGSNYTAAKSRITVSYDYLDKGREDIQWQVGACAQYLTGHQQDILAAHEIRYQTVRTGISGDLYLLDKHRNRISIGLAPSFVFPVKNEIEVPATQINIFTQKIAYPDYYYRSLIYFNGALHLNYMTPHLVRKLYTGFFVKATYLQRLAVRDFQPVPQEDNSGKSRYTLNIGVNLYL